MEDKQILKTPSAAEGEPAPPVEAEDLLNWDEYLPTPPPTRSGTIVVELRYLGPDKPIPFGAPSEK